jgi:hypothetical protein
MELKRIIETTRSGLSVALIGILILAFLMFTFVFIINWEDWFLGTRLAGPFAGVFLFSKAAVAVALMYLLVQYPRHMKAGVILSIGYFGFVFLNSSITYRITTAGQQSFSPVLALFLAIPVILFILTLFSGNSKAGDTTQKPDTDDTPAAVPEGGEKCSKVHPLLLLLGALVLLMICYIIVIPFGVAMVITHIPFLHQMALPPARDSLITRFSPEGTMEWQVAIKGYNLGNAEVVSIPDGGYIIFGPYWISSENGLVNRAVYINRNGTVVWDWRRIADNGPDVDIPDTIRTIISENGEYLLLLDNGRTIRLDFRGNKISEGITTDEERSREAGILFPDAIGVSPLPAPSASVRVRSENGQSTLLTIEDTVSHKEIQNVDVVNPTPDGGFLVSASVKP